MIITGKSIARWQYLATHLLDDVAENERVEVLDCNFSATGNIIEAISDMQALVLGTRGRKGLYHANIRPGPEYSLTPAQWLRAADVLEQELGFQDQPRVVVLHEGRGLVAHVHAVWARTDLETMTLKSDSLTYGAHERAARAIEAELGHDPVPTWRDPEPDGQSEPGGQGDAP